MERDIIQLFIEWKNNKNRKPLLLRGARQVGKTYAVEQFAKKNFANYITLNLDENPELKELFKNRNPQAILDELSVIYNTDVEPGKTLLFIDEIQNCPEAITQLRYFHEKLPQLHLIAAGSLLDHTLNELKLPMPVGRIEFCHMYPMSFPEFLKALGEVKMLDYIKNFSMQKQISEAVHKRMLDLLRYYFFIGGMPEAVYTYVETKKLTEIEKLHSNILTSFRYDFAKYGTRGQQQHLTTVLKYTGQNPCVKIKYVNMDRENRSAVLKEAIRKIELSKIITRVRHSNAANIPLSRHQNDEIYKTLFLDIGLSNSMNRIQLTDPLKLLNIHEGIMAEQFAGQELLHLQPAYAEPELFYWLREEKNADAEVDFLFQKNNTIYPIEIKSGRTGSLKSMHVYLFEKKLTTGIRFNADYPSIGTFNARVRAGSKSGELNFTLISLPLYLISQLPRIIDETGL
ncbi:MAG TPA: AAA family ATPase [Candidatus Paceibacterota bacterium]|nr:AAA family ATPase [Candidatus Paceibacterota bacterium]